MQLMSFHKYLLEYLIEIINFNYEEADIIFINNVLDGFIKGLFYSYNQFLKSKIQKNFTDDVFTRFLLPLNNYKKNLFLHSMICPSIREG